MIAWLTDRNEKDARKSIQEGKGDVPHFLISVWILLPCATSHIVATKVELGHKTFCIFSEEAIPFFRAGVAGFIL